MFKAYSALISLYLDAVEELPSEKISLLEQRVSTELKNYIDTILKFEQVPLLASGINIRDAQFNQTIQFSTHRINQLVKDLMD